MKVHRLNYGAMYVNDAVPYAESPRIMGALIIGALFLVCSFAFGQESQRPGKNNSIDHPAGHSSGNTVDRGKYIVDSVAVCSQCHTPRNSEGGADRSRWLEGAAVWLKPAEPVENWPLQAPRIAGNPPGTDAEMVKLLTTGIWRDGGYLRPPMPQFRMTADDAQAVVAYLKSLQPTPK
jgi:mono/diheme cytochrome c family protein